MKTTWFLLTFTLLSCVLVAQTKLTVDVSKPGIAISPTHYGIFFEDINHAADGGLYAELIRNRSFEDGTNYDFWTVASQSGAFMSATLETTNLLNSTQTKALKMVVSAASPTARAGMANSGFWGINVVKDRNYSVSFFAKCIAGFSGTVTVSLESSAGVKYAEATVSGLTTSWQKFTCSMTANGNDPVGRFVLATNSVGTLWFDMVSCFPPTFKDRTNGLRPELAQLLLDMKPKFMRFPGGCFVEGDVLANRFQWKNTVGPIETRPGHVNLWGYRTSDGMGFHEFLQLAEDLNAEPLYVVNVGLAHNDNQSSTALTDYIQDALDALEYANGAISTTYGAMRAANGHPEPFNIKYLEIGNENYSGNNYGSRYLQFYNAIKAKYPAMNCIGNVAAWGTDSPAWTFTSPVQLLDEHYYRNPTWFVSQYNKYDTYSRTGNKIYVGEYAVTSDCGLGNLSAAVGEAVYMAGMEKNSDIVPLNSYAPIFVNVDDRKWSPDMIDYNASAVYCTPSYYVQKLFATNLGTVNIPVNDSLCRKSADLTGAIGLGTWSTSANYSDILVKNGQGVTVFSDNFANTSNWTPGTGTWTAATNSYTQSSTTLTDCRSIGANITDSVYTYSLKAKKTGGGEGFLIVFGYKDPNNFYWWNIAGWGNTQHAIERCVNGSKSALVTAAGSITSNVWYNVRIEVTKSKVLCYLNDVLIHTLKTDTPLLYTSASLNATDNKLFFKVINPTAADVTSALSLKGVTNSMTGQSTVLSSASALDENSLATPNLVVPVSTNLGTVNSDFNYTFKANSVTVMQLNMTPNSIGQTTRKTFSALNILPNPVGGSFVIKESEVTSIEVLNLLGKSVLKRSFNGEKTVDVSSLESGMYLVKAQIAGGIASATMIKK
jgi:alpha-L-arabinofuranosidase